MEQFVSVAAYHNGDVTQLNGWYNYRTLNYILECSRGRLLLQDSPVEDFEIVDTQTGKNLDLDTPLTELGYDGGSLIIRISKSTNGLLTKASKN